MPSSKPSELDQFANSFKNEDALRHHLQTLLTRMPRNQGVQIVHGAQEYGKDIVFYCPDGFDQFSLHACVVKNEKITGSAEDSSGARGVFSQVEQALDTPFIKGTGEEETVTRVYVISPFDCPQTTMNSIRGKLKTRSGQVDFFCGSRLIEIFAKYWPEFLAFESSLLGSYVAEIKRSFDQSDPIAFLMGQHSILAGAVKTLSSVYVRQEFQVPIVELEFLVEPLHVPSAVLLSESDLDSINESIVFASTFLAHSQVWEEPVFEEIEGVRNQLERLRKELKASWVLNWEKSREETEKVGRTASRRTSKFVIDMSLDSFKGHLSCANTALQSFGECVRIANQLAMSLSKGPFAEKLNSEDFLTYCRVQEVVKLSPTAFKKKKLPVLKRFAEDLLDRSKQSLLVTAPAGYGKTSFCKWNVLNDIQQLIDRKSNVLPIYVPLHQLATSSVSSYEDAFVRTDEMRQLVQSAQMNRQEVRLYLDGLDEVTTVEQQNRLLSIAFAMLDKFNCLRIIVTGRDYVSGPLLRRLGRVQLSELNDSQVLQLTRNWLGNDEEQLKQFFAQLNKSRDLLPLMNIPLLGTLIIGVYKKLKSLPENRLRLYEIFIDLMCGGWDLAKNVKRETRFGSSAKLSVLTRLAATLHLNGKREAKESDIRVAVNSTMPVLSSQWRNMLDEILEDGLLVRMGANLAFSHLSYQEYLTARDLSDPSGSRQQYSLRKYLSGENWWREAVAFYLTDKRPDEMEQWIRKNIERLSERPFDLQQRYDYLLTCISDASPGWSAKHQAPLSSLSRHQPSGATSDE